MLNSRIKLMEIKQAKRLNISFVEMRKEYTEKYKNIK